MDQQPMRRFFSLTVGDTFRVKVTDRYAVWKVTGVFVGIVGQETLVGLVSLDSDMPNVYGKRPDELLVPLILLEKAGLERV